MTARALVSLGSCGVAAGGRAVKAALARCLDQRQLEVSLGETGCLGLCYREVIVRLESDALGSCVYGEVTPAKVPELVDAHFGRGEPMESLLIQGPADCREAAFLEPQARIVLRNCGRIDPGSLADYRAQGGYTGLDRARGLDPEALIEVTLGSGLRGRGGAGFPTGRKWALARRASDLERYLVCNADEGDPGAFMDRSILEGDPFAVLEGMAIAARAIGASRGFIYVREEYPLAVERLRVAAAAARAGGGLGPDARGAGLGFDVELRRGAGAFVCGEETALIASLEGRRGSPRRRPPFPAERGYQGHPTVINNVETLANVAWVFSDRADDQRRAGTGGLADTKVFSLAGDIRRTGLVEVPIGTPLGQIIEDIGGGSVSGRPIKALQIGGPSGGCLPARLFDTPVDYESIQATGAIMGSGGMIAMDSSRCMVDVARYFLSFTQRESCGKCTFCRVGTTRMLEILERLCGGEGRVGDIERLEALARQVGAGSLCGLGRSAPNPVLTTLRYFRDEYEAHLEQRSCPAGRCKALISYQIDPYICEGCTLCRDQCAVGAIHLQSGVIPLRIDTDPCVRCGGCEQICQFNAVGVL